MLTSQSRWYWSAIVILGSVLLLTIYPPTMILAQTGIPEGEVCTSEGYGFDAWYEDGSPRQITLLCDLPEDGTPNDLLTIIDRDRDMDAASDWPEVADYRDDIWIFDHRGDGEVDLIIDFYAEDEMLVADLYDSRNPVDGIDYRVADDGRLQVLNRRGPTVQVIARDGWWVRGDTFNNNLDIYVDGSVLAAFDVSAVSRLFETDGRLDYTIHIRDADHDGKAEYDWRTVHFPELVPEELAHIQRTYLMVNVADNEAPIEAFLPWPYLGPVSFGYLLSSPHQTTKAPIQVSWGASAIDVIGEFVTSRGNDQQWFVYSDYELKQGIAENLASFESPFAWYDMADDKDGRPELAIRVLYTPPVPTGLFENAETLPMSIIRYSWDQDNDGYWDYKLGLAARHEVDSIVSIPILDLNINLIAYEDLAEWVIDRPWSTVTFVVSEQADTLGEGIYEWDPSPWMRDQFFTGVADTPLPVDEAGGFRLEELRFDAPEDTTSKIDPGMRGEYNFTLQDKVSLYVSSIDHRLHLYNAEGGIWNVHNIDEIRYFDLDADGYFDNWRYGRNDQVYQQVIFVDDYLIYADTQTVRVKRVELPPATLETTPPRNHEEWRILASTMAEVGEPFGANEFRQMYDQFEVDEEWRIDRATLRGFRLTENGFRYVLELSGWFHWDSGPSFPRAPGAGLSEYLARLDMVSHLLITYEDGHFSLRPLTPPSISLAPEALEIDSELVALETKPLAFTLQNTGLQDVQGLAIKLIAKQDGYEPQAVGQTMIDISGKSVKTVHMQWAPSAGGEWTLELEGATQEPTYGFLVNGMIVSEELKTVTVKSAESTARTEFLSLRDELPDNGLLIPLLMLSLAISAAILSAIIINYSGTPGTK